MSALADGSKPWQFAEMPDGTSIPDLITSEFIDHQWRAGYVATRMNVFIPLPLALVFLSIPASFIAATLPPETGAAVWWLILGGLTALVLGNWWTRLSSNSMFSRLVMLASTLGKNRNPFEKGERELETGMVTRALEEAKIQVVRSTKRRYWHRWDLGDGSIVRWYKPSSGKHGITPSELTIYTPRSGSVDVHRRFKGQVLQTIDEVKAEVARAARPDLTAKLA